jgi:ABC-type sugar transport system ATPase subunit
MASVELKNITKRFGSVEVIRDVNLSVDEGSFCALLGPSGCGKSTLLRMIAGLEPVTAGQVVIDGNDVTNVAPAQRRIAMVFQSYALYPHLTVRGNICFSMSLAGMPKAKQNERADVVAKMLQLEELMDRRPAQLSGGQRQRVAIGRALVRDPQVFLFDEPLSNLDALLRVQMRLELAKLHQTLKTTMIYVTHDQVEAMTLADKIVVLDKGVIAQSGSPLELYNNPANRFVASFIGSPAMNFVQGSIKSITAKGIALQLRGDVKLNLNSRKLVLNTETQDIEIGVRPEHLTLVKPNDKSAVFKGKTTVVEQLGNTTYAYIDTPSGQLIVEADSALEKATGTPVGIAVDTERLHIFESTGNRLTLN